MAGVNRATILGNVGNDPDIRSMNSGDRVANLSIATSETWKDKQTQEKKEKTEWHRIVIWGPLVDVVEKYVHKGSKLYVEGKLQTRKWTDQNGVEKYTTEIVLQGFGGVLQLLDGKPQGDGNQSRHQRPADQGGGFSGGGGGGFNGREDFAADLDDEIPFVTNRSIW